MSNLTGRLRRDFDDDDADEEIIREGCKQDTRIVREECKCPTPKLCRFVDTVCTRCRRRSGHYSETEQLYLLAQALEGGLPLAAGDLPFHVWVGLGMIRGRMHS